MSVAAEELRNQLNQTTKKADVEEPDKAENKSINHFATFPWLYGILRKCREAIGTKQTNTLESLLYALVKELTVSIKDCYSRPNRAGKLRDIVCQMLVYFHLIYRDLKVEYRDSNGTYLHLMTELLAMYLDLEIKASKRGIHSLKKIGQFMTMALYTHLGESEDHIVEAILKAKLITKSAGELCAPVLLKVLNDAKCFVFDENSYVRFLLAFKLLQKITKRTDRFDVTKMAMKKLHPAPEFVKIVRNMTNIFPLQRVINEPLTVFLMNANFDFIKAKLEFLRTGSISKDSIANLYPDKPFTYGNRSNSTINLLKNCREDEQKRNSSIYDAWSNDKNKIGCSIDFELEPNMYRLSLWSEDDNKVKMCKIDEDDGSGIEFLGTENKGDKQSLQTVVITLDSDEEMNEVENNTLQTIAKSNNNDCLPPNDEEKELEKEQTEKKHKKNHYTVTENDSSDEKCESNEEIILTKITNVPEKEENPDSDCKEKNLSTKNIGGLLSSKPQGSEHGVTDSTNNCNQSVESARSPLPNTCLVEDTITVEESRLEVSNTLESYNCIIKMRDKCCHKPQEFDKTVSRVKLKPSNITKNDVPNVKKDLNGTLNNNACEKKSNPVGLCRANGSLQNNLSKTVKNTTRSVITSGPLVQGKVGANIQNNNTSISSSNLEQNNKNEKSNNIQNDLQTVKNQQKGKSSKTDSMIANDPTKNASCQVGVSQRINQNKAKLDIVKSNESKQTQHVGKTLKNDNERSISTKRLVNESVNHTSKETKFSQIGKGEIGSKNFTLASGNLNKLISSSAKKVNFENVAKSYKIVKSNRLKASELSRSSNGHNKELTCKNENCTPKIIKIEKSSLIENNLKVNERVKFVSKNLDFRTPKIDGDLNNLNKKGREKCESTKSIDDKSVKSRSRTSQCVPIIFKKIEETKSQGSGRKRKKSEKVDGEQKSPKPRETTKRKSKSTSSNTIKTDIDMKSTLRHINPSSIPQFSEDASKNCKKRKCTVVEPTTSKIKCVENNSSGDTSESRTVEIKLVIPEKFLELHNIDKLQVRGKETPCIPLIYPSIVHFPLNLEHILNTAFPHTEDGQTDGVKTFPSFYVNQLPLQNEKFDKGQKIQDNTTDPSDKFFIGGNVEVPTVNESGKAYAIPFEQVYQETFSVVNCNGMKNDENGKSQDGIKNGENGKSDDGLKIGENGKSDDLKNEQNKKPEDGLKYQQNGKSECGMTYEENGKSNDGMKYDEYGKSDYSNEKEITDLVQHEEGMNIIDDKRCESHGRTSSMEVGMELSGQLCNAGKFPLNTRDLAINEISPVDLKFVDEELGKYDDPWEDPKECCPEDDEFFLRSLPDPQKLFCEDDYKRLLDDALHPIPNISIDTIRPEDFADLDIFSKSVCDHGDEHDINNLESTCNENTFALNEKFPGCEVSHIIEVQPNQYEPCEKSASLSPPEYQGDDQSKTRFEKGRRSRSNSSSSSFTIKSRRRSYATQRSKSELGGLKERPWQLDNLRSDSIPYHTRSISQKGIPVEYTLPEPKKVPGKRNRPS